MERNVTDPEAGEAKATEVKVIRCYVNRVSIFHSQKNKALFWCIYGQNADQEDVTDSAIFDITQKLR